jgi:hypothetical protein
LPFQSTLARHRSPVCPVDARSSRLMTVPAILVILAFIVVFLALNRFEFGRFD